MSTTRLIINQAIKNVFENYSPGQCFDEPNLIFYTSEHLKSQGYIISHVEFEIHSAIYDALNIDNWLFICGNGIFMPFDDDLTPTAKLAKAQKIPINNHTCPTCKETRVSLLEKVSGIPCWKCGNKL